MAMLDLVYDGHLPLFLVIPSNHSVSNPLLVGDNRKIEVWDIL